MTRRPLAALVLASVLWGGAVTGTKYALRGFSPVTLLSVELLAAAGVLWAVLFAAFCPVVVQPAGERRPRGATTTARRPNRRPRGQP